MVDAAMVTMVDWDAWRTDYDHLTFVQQQRFYDNVADFEPNQTHVEAEPVQHSMRGVRTVTELGGWTGMLADLMLRMHPAIQSWTNYEICQWATGEGNGCDRDNYYPVALADWPWNTELLPADLLVASHVLEHMRFAQLQELAKQFPKFKRLHFQIPIPLIGNPYWHGYPGSHILEVGWETLHTWLTSLGLNLVYSGPLTCRTYET